MRKDVREFIRRLEAAGLTVEPTPGHYHVLREGKPLRKTNGLPFTLPFSPDTIRQRRAAILELRKLGISVQHPPETPKPADLSVTGLRQRHVLTRALRLSSHSSSQASSDSAYARGYSLSEHANDDGFVWDDID